MFQFLNFKVVSGILILILAAFLIPNLVEWQDASEYMVIQYPSGTLEVFLEQGPHSQWFGTVQKYPRRFQYWFSSQLDQGEAYDQAIKIRFNEGGHALMSGSVSVELPANTDQLLQIHKMYGNYQNVQSQLVRTTIEKAVYMSGPLMSSKESSAGKRTELLNYIVDQAVYGVYKTKSKTVTQDDGLGNKRTVSIVEIVMDTTKNIPIREEQSPLIAFGVKLFNPSLNEIAYDAEVEEQIKGQQRLEMEVQTAMAQAKKSEQAVITAEKNGEAKAAEAKWEQMVIKAQKVTEAEQKLEVAKLEVATAEQYKRKKILEAEADAEYKRKIIVADGALEQKLRVYTEVMTVGFQEFAKQKWVPDIQMGSGTNGSTNAVQFMELLSAKTARDLGLDLGIIKK